MRGAAVGLVVIEVVMVKVVSQVVCDTVGLGTKSLLTLLNSGRDTRSRLAGPSLEGVRVGVVVLALVSGGGFNVSW